MREREGRVRELRIVELVLCRGPERQILARKASRGGDLVEARSGRELRHIRLCLGLALIRDALDASLLDRRETRGLLLLVFGARLALGHGVGPGKRLRVDDEQHQRAVFGGGELELSAPRKRR